MVVVKYPGIQGKLEQSKLFFLVQIAYTIQINGKSGDEECRKMVLPELTYMKIIRKSQAKKYPKL